MYIALSCKQLHLMNSKDISIEDNLIKMIVA